jgi:hypothetical protein
VDDTFLTHLRPLIWEKACRGLWMPNLAGAACHLTQKRVIQYFKSGHQLKTASQPVFVSGVCSNVIHELNRAAARLVRQILAELPERDAELLRQDMLEGDKDVLCQQFGVTREYLWLLRQRIFERLRVQLRKIYTDQPET